VISRDNKEGLRRFNESGVGLERLKEIERDGVIGVRMESESDETLNERTGENSE